MLWIIQDALEMLRPRAEIPRLQLVHCFVGEVFFQALKRLYHAKMTTNNVLDYNTNSMIMFQIHKLWYIVPCGNEALFAIPQLRNPVVLDTSNKRPNYGIFPNYWIPHPHWYLNGLVPAYMLQRLACDVLIKSKTLPFVLYVLGYSGSRCYIFETSLTILEFSLLGEEWVLGCNLHIHTSHEFHQAVNELRFYKYQILFGCNGCVLTNFVFQTLEAQGPSWELHPFFDLRRLL